MSGGLNARRAIGRVAGFARRAVSVRALGVSAIGRVRVGCLIWQPSGLPKMATGSVAYYGNRRAFGVGAA